MTQHQDIPENWKKLARQNAFVAKFLCERYERCCCSAVSRLYYSLFQTTVWLLVTKGNRRPRWDHREVSDDASKILNNIALSVTLSALYDWRRKADYARGRITPKQAQQLAASTLPLLTQLGIADEYPGHI